jgi:hypothetical protein
MFDFKEQLGVGQRGEDIVKDVYPRKLAVYEGREYDFVVEDTGEKVEIKTDTYDMAKTPNFFMERYSDNYRRTPGGLWRASQDSVDIFIYLFPKNFTYFEFMVTRELIDKLNKLTAKVPLCYIKNRSWHTSGYKVHRDSMSEYYNEVRYA